MPKIWNPLEAEINFHSYVDYVGYQFIQPNPKNDGKPFLQTTRFLSFLVECSAPFTFVYTDSFYGGKLKIDRNLLTSDSPNQNVFNYLGATLHGLSEFDIATPKYNVETYCLNGSNMYRYETYGNLFNEIGRRILLKKSDDLEDHLLSNALVDLGSRENILFVRIRPSRKRRIVSVNILTTCLADLSSWTNIGIKFDTYWKDTNLLSMSSESPEYIFQRPRKYIVGRNCGKDGKLNPFIMHTVPLFQMLPSSYEIIKSADVACESMSLQYSLFGKKGLYYANIYDHFGGINGNNNHDVRQLEAII